MPRWKPFEPYFWSLVLRGEGCWIWQGGRDRRGYGKVWFNGRRERSHRVAHALSKGPIGGLHVLHHCDNPPCVNPDHLFLGTHADNMRDCTKKKRNTLIENPSLWATGDKHWTRQKTKGVKAKLRRISKARKDEWKSGRRVAIRDAKGRIMGTKMVGGK